MDEIKMGAREQAAILILFAVVISASFVIIDQRNRINELYHTRFELNHLEAQYSHLYDSYKEQINLTRGLRLQIIQLNHDLDKIERYEETWHTYRDKYEEVLLENARLQGLLITQEYGDNITKPLVEPRKAGFRIGDTIGFKVESEIALYGSHFMIYDPNNTLVWDGDPLAEWKQINDHWTPPYYGQTAYMEPMVLTENYTLGNWTYVYWFGDIKMGEGWFPVDEAIKDFITVGFTDLSHKGLAEDITNVSDIAEPGMGSQAEPVFARDSTCSNPYRVPVITTVLFASFVYLRNRAKGNQ